MFAVIFIPNFSLQAVLRHEPELLSRAVALVDCEEQGGLTSTSFQISRSHGRGPLRRRASAASGTRPSQIIQLTASARAHGVCEGLTTPQAMARCGDLISKPRSLAREQAATEILLQTAYAFSPNIESTAPGVCTVELKGLGLQSNYGLVEQWSKKILQALAQFHLAAQIGFAATPELALLAAHAAKPICIVQNADEFVASLPLAALSPAPEISDILHRWGIHTIGALLELGKDNIAERLGPEAVELFERVSPNPIRPLKLVVPAEDFVEQMEFEHEIETIEPLLFVLRRFIEQLSRRVELIYLVIAEFHLRLGLASGANCEHVFKIPSPTGSVETLFRMLQTHLETVRTDSPIVSLRLSAKPCHADKHQFGLFESTLRNPNQFAETLARLTALCGPERVGTPQLEATCRPDAFRMKTPEFGATKVAQASRLHDERADTGTYLTKGRAGSPLPAARTNDGAHGMPRPILYKMSSDNLLIARKQVIKEISSALRARFTDETPAPRYRGLQLRRFRPALSAQTECREQRPALLRSSVFNGTITDARGPFFSSGNWWEQNTWSRAEWDAQADDGTLLRLVQQEDGWFVEGVYD